MLRTLEIPSWVKLVVTHNNKNGTIDFSSIMKLVYDGTELMMCAHHLVRMDSAACKGIMLASSVFIYLLRATRVRRQHNDHSLFV